MEIPLKTERDTEKAVKNVNKAIRKAAWQTTPDKNEQNFKEERPVIVKQKVADKRKDCKRWKLQRVPQDKQRYNKLAK